MVAATVVIGGPGICFSAAHAGMHNGVLEPLHGHTYQVTLRVHGSVSVDGMVVDFDVVKPALRAAIRPLHRRTLVAGHCPGALVEQTGDTVRITAGGRRYELPATDVVVLPITNTSTEELATYVLGVVMDGLSEAGIGGAELELAESPGTSALVHTRSRAEGCAGTSGDDRADAEVAR
ncbi:hypothetical protein GZH49_37605 [Nocardia terpenica]|uniref:6-pyruvoyl trahydropterin synthase family protein n=1 Tax=Nocardia terpenica TaxID=455432 RepID=UPI002FE0ADEF